MHLFTMAGSEEITYTKFAEGPPTSCGTFGHIQAHSRYIVLKEYMTGSVKKPGTLHIRDQLGCFATHK